MSENNLDPNVEDLPEIDGQPMEPEPMAPPTSELAADLHSDQLSAKDLSADIFGGEDFDLPPPPSGASGGQMVSKPLSTFTPPKPAAPGPLPGGAPSFSAFKQPGGGPMFKPAGAPPPAAAPAPVATPSIAMPAPTPFSLAEVGHEPNWDDIKHALQSPEAPAKVPSELGALAFHLCRALVKKGVISIDELFAELH